MLKNYPLALAAALLTGAAAQTYSDCNPTNETNCDSDTALSSSTYSVDFTAGADTDNWESVGSGDVDYTDNGAEFTITSQGDAPTIQTQWYIFFGRVEVHMKAASGTGIVSCSVLLSDDLDEIDWEWLGGSADEVQTNYFGKGDSSSTDRDTTVAVTDTQATSHNYTVYWTESSCVWYVDGTAVRTLTYDDADSGAQYPQTPMRVKLGIWAGGDSTNSEGTIEWAGGDTDYDDGPFTMTVESVEVTNFNTGASYTYGDQTGDYSSIVVNESDDDDSESSSSSESSTKTSTSKTTISKTTSVSGSSSATTVSIATDSSAAIESPSNSSDTTPTSSSVAVVTSTAEGLGSIISPSTWIISSAIIIAILGHL